MKSGAPPTELKARTGLSTPPGRMSLARAKSCLEREVVSLAVIQNSKCKNKQGLDSVFAFFILHFALQRPRRITRVIGDDHLRACATNRDERFHHHARLVDPSICAAALSIAYRR
jgi:hypothetical protein